MINDPEGRRNFLPYQNFIHARQKDRMNSDLKLKLSTDLHDTTP